MYAWEGKLNSAKFTPALMGHHDQKKSHFTSARLAQCSKMNMIDWVFEGKMKSVKRLRFLFGLS